MILNFLCFFILSSDFSISAAQWYQEISAVAYAKEKYLVVWEDCRKTGDYLNNDIWGQLVSKEGVLIDTNFPIVTRDKRQCEIDIVHGDSSYLIIWVDGMDVTSYDIWGQFISEDGKLIDTPFVIENTSNHKGDPHVVWGNGQFFAVWAEGYYPYPTAIPDSSKIKGRFLNPDGSPIDSTFYIGFAGRYNARPHLAFDGKNYLVGWSSEELKAPYDVYGQIVDSVGVLIGTNFHIIEGQSTQLFLGIASNGTNYFVVGVIPENHSIVGQVVGLDGSLIGTLVMVGVEPDSVGRGDPTIKWDGTRYIVVWLDKRNGPTTVYGQWVSKDGGLVGQNFAISSKSYFEYHPAIGCSDDSSCLVVYNDEYDLWGVVLKFTGIEEKSNIKNPSTTLRASPNPFIQSTTISYQLANKSPVSLKLYDITGRTVKSILPSDKTEQQPGSYNIKLNTSNLPAGIYFVKLSTNTHSITQKLTILR